MAARNRRKSRRAKGNGWLSALAKFFPAAAVFLLCAGLFAGVQNVLAGDPGLAIRKISVEPPGVLSVSEREGLESKWLGKNILQVDLARMARQIEKNPAVRTARVLRELPSEIRIEIQGRAPTAWIRFSPKGKLAVVSRDGVILEIFQESGVGATGRSPLLVIEAYALGLAEPRRGLQVASRGFEEAMKFLDLFLAQPVGERGAPSRITLDASGNVTVIFGKGPEIRLGKRPSERLAALERVMPLLEGPEREKIEYLDLQFDQVILKRKR